MAKCATCLFHAWDKRLENARFLSNYNEAKTMHFHAFIQMHRKCTWQIWQGDLKNKGVESEHRCRK